MKHLNFILITAVVFNFAFSSNSKIDGGKKNQAKMVKKIKMIKHLDLDEKQSVKLFTREKDLDKKIQAINAKKTELRKKMGEVRRKETVTQGEVDAIIDEMHALDGQRKQLKQKHQKGVGDILSPTQRLKYVDFDDHFKKEMKDKIKKGKKPKRRKKIPK